MNAQTIEATEVEVNYCRCNCGEAVNWNYVRGHDGRHATRLFEELQQLWVEVNEANKAPAQNPGTKAYAEADGRDQRRRARVMGAAITAAVEALPRKRADRLLAKLAKTDFADIAAQVDSERPQVKDA